MKVHIIMFYQTDGIEYIPERFPTYFDEQIVKEKIKELNNLNSLVGIYGYITKDVV